MSNSPWSAWAVIQQVQVEIAATPGLERGGVLILDESADVKAGKKHAQYGPADAHSLPIIAINSKKVFHIVNCEKFFDNIPKKQYFFHPHPQSFTPLYNIFQKRQLHAKMRTYPQKMAMIF